jgi:class 3 adenylate cyclase
MKTQLIFLFLLFNFCATLCMGQQRDIDSLKKVIAGAADDTLKVNALNALSKKYFGSDPSYAIIVAMRAKDLAGKINFPRGLAYAFKHIGIGYYYQSRNIEALDNWNQSLALFDSLHDLEGMVNIQGNLGTVYFDQGNDEKSLEYYLMALKTSEQLEDKFRIVNQLANIGNVYANKKENFDKALEYFMRVLPYRDEIKDRDEEMKDIIGSAEVGIGEIYLKRDSFNLDSALFYFEKSLKTYEGTAFIAYSLNDIGKLYTKKKDFNAAIKNHEEALQRAKKLDNKLEMSRSLLGLGNAYLEDKRYKEAIDAYRRGEIIATEVEADNEVKEIYEGTAKVYSGIKDFTKAFEYQKLLTDIKEKLYNIATYKKVGALQFTFDIQKKKEQIDLQQLDLKRQKTIRNITIAGLSVVMGFLVLVFFQKKRITKEKKRSDELLLNILPEETAEELKATGTAKAKSFDMVSVLFTDFKNFTQASEKLSPEELVAEINYCYSEFDKIITAHHIEKIKTIGDAYMCAGGLPVANTTNAVDIVLAGLEMVKFIERNKQERLAKDQPFFELRCGIHTGPVVAGIVGIKKFAYDIWGDTVNTASRMESSGETGRVNISGTTYELIKDKFICTHRGKVKAKNKGEIDMYFVEGAI